MPCNHKAHARELSRLARIKLTSEEEKTLEENIQNILKYMDQIEEVDTEGVAVCTTVLPTLKNILAEDEPGEPFDRQTFLKNTPDQVGEMIKIPPPLDQ